MNTIKVTNICIKKFKKGIPLNIKPDKIYMSGKGFLTVKDTVSEAYITVDILHKRLRIVECDNSMFSYAI